MASAKKAAEAAEHILQAEKFLKTGFLKWKPDYELAADSYEKAATCYKTSKDLPKCKDCLYKAADCYKQTKSYFSAAKNLDQAVLILREMSEWKEIVTVAHKACQLYQEYGSPDTAALSLDKSGKVVEAHLPEEALNIYARAMEVVMLEDRPRQAAEYATKCSRLLVKLGKYDEAVNMISKEMNYQIAAGNVANVGRSLVALVLVHLVREDVIAAGKAIQEWGGNGEEQELQVALQLHAAFDSEEPEQAKRALADPFIRHMDVEFSKLTRIISLPKEFDSLETAAKSAVLPTAEPSMKKLNIDDLPAIDDDELENEFVTSPKEGEATEEDGLC